MYVCPECASTVDVTRLSGGHQCCPDCGAAVRLEDEHPWVDVARVTNLAEAGFLTDELVGLGVDAQIYQLQEFSALTNRWESLYLIRVPADASREAAAQIRQHLAEDAIERENEPAAFRFEAHDQPLDPLIWRPVALVILAGVSSFVLGQRFSKQDELKVERRPLGNSLASAVDEIGQPLVTEPAPGRPRHRLTFDRRRETWFLETDRDGDGRYDNQQAFQATGASR
jgi:hypothetical protein